MGEEGFRPDAVIVDPPRSGCDQGLIKSLLDVEAKQLVYVSCNPSTLARDLALLAKNTAFAICNQSICSRKQHM